MANQRAVAHRVRKVWSTVLSGMLGMTLALALAGLVGAATATAEKGGPTLAEVQGLIEAGDYAAARQAYQRLRESGERDWLVEFKLGVLAVEAGRPEEAEEYFHSSLALNPDYGASYYNLALLAYRRNDPAAALAYAEQALPRYRGEGRERVRYDALALAGLAAGMLGQEEKAVRYLEQACALFPQSLLAYQILAELYLNAGEERQAQSVYARMLRAALRVGFEPYDVLIIYARRGGQALEFSGRLLEELLPAAEGDQRALAGVEYGLGHIRYLEGRREEARAHFRRAREHLAFFLKPDDPALAKMEELEKACQ